MSPSHHPAASSGHTDLGVTSIYLHGVANAEFINAAHERRPPVMAASAGLRR